MELRNQIAKSGVHVDVDARKGQDLAQVMADIRSKYEKMAQKNQEQLKTWHESQVTIKLNLSSCAMFSCTHKKIYVNYYFVISIDHRGANTGYAEHRGPEVCPNRGERPAQTNTDHGDRSRVTEEPGEKHLVITQLISSAHAYFSILQC